MAVTRCLLPDDPGKAERLVRATLRTRQILGYCSAHERDGSELYFGNTQGSCSPFRCSTRMLTRSGDDLWARMAVHDQRLEIARRGKFAAQREPPKNARQRHRR